jgi:hypothetical protein
LGFKFSQSLSYFIQVLKGIEAASSHEETAVKFSEMKEETLLEMERAHRGGKLTAEYDSHVQLVELAIIQTDWQAAAKHIHQIIEWHATFDGGWFAFNNPEDRLLRWARYGIVWLKLGVLSKAIGCFTIGKKLAYARDEIADILVGFNSANMSDDSFCDIQATWAQARPAKLPCQGGSGDCFWAWLLNSCSYS